MKETENWKKKKERKIILNLNFFFMKFNFLENQ